MEVVLQGANSQPSISSGTQSAFRDNVTHASPQTQMSNAGRPSPLARQGAMFEINPQTELNTNVLGRQEIEHTDPRILSPVTARYDSVQSQTQHQSSQITAQGSSAYQPFLGMHSLSSEPLSTSNVNQARRISASTMVHRTRNGRTTTGSTGGSNSRGPLPLQRTGVSKGNDFAKRCRVDTRIRAQFRIYPPCVLDVSVLSAWHEFHMPQRLLKLQDDDLDMDESRFPSFRIVQETVVGFLRDNYMVWETVLESTSLLSSAFEQVRLNMEESPAAYQFVDRAGPGFLRGPEAIGLTLLEHVNRGHVSRDSNQSTLRPTSYTALTTIEALLTDKVRFGVIAHGLGFYNDHLVINAGKLRQL